MTTKRVFLACLFLIVCAAAQAATIAPWVLEHTRNGNTAEFFVVLKQKADLYPAYTLPTKADRGRYVFAMLYQTAEDSQTPLRQWLDERGIQYQSFYIINALLLTGDRKLVRAMAARDDVDRIEGNPVIHNELPAPEPAPSSPDSVEWNITKVGAPKMWPLGFTGQGIVVGGGDTGYRWTHNALKPHYRGWNGTVANHDYNWHDSIHPPATGGSCGADSVQPCDDFGHGTHTMGTVLGDDGGTNQIGVAPGAKWIGCRNMDQGNGTPARYIECFQFFLAPYPVGGNPGQGDPTKAPDVTSNSWSCPPSEGCSASSLQAAVDAQKAAGIMTVVAATNSGPGCSTVVDPPSIYDSAYTVGATDSSDNMAGFSSRGPAASTGLTKPNISAPGSNVRSSWNGSDSDYQTASGTSMATPNVAGGVALLWSAIAALQNQQDATETALNNGAVRFPNIVESCGGDYVNGPNNTWGNGRMDVYAAYQCYPTPPAAPTNITFSLNGSNQLVISWDAVPGVAGYSIYRGTGSCPGSAFTSRGTSATNSFTDTTASRGTTYRYIIKALVTWNDVDTCASLFSACASVLVPNCTYSIAPLAKNFGSGGGSDTVTVTTPSLCPWTAVSNDTWIHVDSGSPGTGNGTVGYSVDPNPGTTPLTGTMTIAGKTFTVTQDKSCLFCDDFEDGVLASDWTYIKPSWTETGGQLIGTPAPRKALTIATPAFAGCLNCTVHTALSSGGGATSRVWVFAWYTDKSNFVEVMMKEAQDTWVLKQVAGGQVVAKAKASATIFGGIVYNVDITFDGTSFHLSIDGVEKIVMTPGAPVSAGTVGFQVRNTVAAFNEIAVN